jgi:hypothetical protein
MPVQEFQNYFRVQRTVLLFYYGSSIPALSQMQGSAKKMLFYMKFSLNEVPNSSMVIENNPTLTLIKNSNANVHISMYSESLTAVIN